MTPPNDSVETDYAAALANFAYKGGAVRLIEPITDTYERANEWGRLEKDEYTVPFGPWSEPDTVSGGPWVWRYGTATAATGSSYRVLATRVHADVASCEGGPIVVTVLSPWSAAYSLSDQGYLDESYVADKFLGGRSVHGGDLAALTRLIGLLLGRETSSDLLFPPGQSKDAL